MKRLSSGLYASLARVASSFHASTSGPSSPGPFFSRVVGASEPPTWSETRNSFAGRAFSLYSSAALPAEAKISPVEKPGAPLPQGTPVSGPHYKVTVFTGDIRGAGTKADASLELATASGTKLVLETTDGFERGSRRVFFVPSPEDLGSLKHLVVKIKDMGITEFGAGW